MISAIENYAKSCWSLVIKYKLFYIFGVQSQITIQRTVTIYFLIQLFSPSQALAVFKHYLPKRVSTT